jgi:two-component system cell cycle response regulator
MNAVAAHTDPAVAREIVAVLADFDWTVTVADEPDEVVEACRATEADVLLLDAELPGALEGVLDRIKRDPAVYRTAVVMLATAPDPETVESWQARGVVDVLRLPLAAGEVLGRVVAAARTKALVGELTLQNSRLEDLLFFDELTGLRNRRAALNEMEMLLAGARRHGHELSVLMLDIDRFKSINDRYGHRAGDDVLREVSRRLRGRLRRQDLGGRLGGDELIVVLPDTDVEGATTAAESIRAEVAASPVRTSAGPIEVTVSIGSAAWAGDELARLLERADAALYAAKTSGRNSTAEA